MGVLSQICIRDFNPDPVNASIWSKAYFDRAWLDHMSNGTNWVLSEATGKHILCGNSSGAGTCPEGTTCLQVYIDLYLKIVASLNKRYTIEKCSCRRV